MSDQADNEVTQILNDLSGTNGATPLIDLLPAVYRELRALSESYLRNERADHTLQATALVHEAYVRLARRNDGAWQDRAHFFRVAAKTMRRILINHARDHRAQRRGGGRRRVQLEESAIFCAGPDLDLIALDDALDRLARLDAEKAKVVELRFFAGCTVEETAQTLNTSTATVERHWRFARAWLLNKLAGDGHA
jgi:RNA polymerase sigma factor (TIGR02999 family)